MVLTAAETRGVWSLIPACATADAADLEARDTVDLDKLAAMVERLIQAGVNGIATTGTLGEGATLLWDEHQKLIRETSTAFFDAYLKNDAAAKKWLDEEKVIERKP